MTFKPCRGQSVLCEPTTNVKEKKKTELYSVVVLGHENHTSGMNRTYRTQLFKKKTYRTLSFVCHIVAQKRKKKSKL